MSRSGFPSMTALLGLLAIAGYQNRDKIAEMLRGLGQNNQTGQRGAEGNRVKAALAVYSVSSAAASAGSALAAS